MKLLKFTPKKLKHFGHIKEYNWLIHKIIINFLEETAHEYAHGKLIDIGCGIKPYESIFSPYLTEYIGLDLEKSSHGSSHADIKADAYNTTLEDNSCDLILCSEVLEHLEEPAMALKEMNRILKDEGVIILTVPFFWHIHEPPRDFYRYSEYGLRYLFEQAGFEVIEIKPLTGFIVTFSQLSIYFFQRFQRGAILKTIGRILNWGIQHLAYMFNKYDKSTEFTNLYGIVARKASMLDKKPCYKGVK